MRKSVVVKRMRLLGILILEDLGLDQKGDPFEFWQSEWESFPKTRRNSYG